MAFKLLNRVRMSVSGAAGTGALTLNLPTVGAQSFVDGGLADGDSTAYVIEDGTPIGSAWEIGVGSWHSNGTFTRDTVTASSVGGTTKISATANAIINATLRAEDLAGLGSVGGNSAPTVVQHASISVVNGSGNAVITLGSAPTVGNLLVAIGNSPKTDGSHGFDWISADNQFNVNSTTAWEPGWGYRVVQSGDGTSWTIGLGDTTGGPDFMFNGVLLEISGASVVGIRTGEGVLSSTPLNVVAAAFTNMLSIAFFGGNGAASPTITDPATLQVSTFNSGQNCVKAGWSAVASNGYAGLAGSVASGGNGVLAVNIPGV